MESPVAVDPRAASHMPRRSLEVAAEAGIPPRDVPTFRIHPTKGWGWLDLRELWRYRELAYFLTWRDIKVRYKQTAIGVGWAILQLLAMMAVFALFFGRLAKLPSGGVPYPLFAYVALWPWQLFSRVITESMHSLIIDQRLIMRVYFPRLIVPVATIFAATVDFRDIDMASAIV